MCHPALPALWMSMASDIDLRRRHVIRFERFVTNVLTWWKLFAGRRGGAMESMDYPALPDVTLPPFIGSIIDYANGLSAKASG